IQDGVKIAPALSTLTADDLDRNLKREELETDLERAGIDKSSQARHQQFIRSWLDAVVPEGETEDEATENAAQNSSLRDATTGTDLDQDTVRAFDSISLQGFRSSRLMRGISYMSKAAHRNNAGHRDPNQGYILLEKLLDLQYPTKKSQDLTIKLIFQHLDWHEEGYLHRSDVERHCRRAIDAFLTLSEAYLMNLVRSVDRDRDGRINSKEFNVLCHELIDLAIIQDEERATEDIVSSIPAGAKEVELECDWLRLHQPWKVLLPYGWQAVKSETGVETFQNIFTEEVSTFKPAFDKDSFGGMTFIILRILIPRISQVRESWNREITGFPQRARIQYFEAFQKVLNAALRFSCLEGENGPCHYTTYDSYLHAARSIPKVEGLNFMDCPTQALEEAQQRCHKIISQIQGFAFDLKPVDDKVFLKNEFASYAADKRFQKISSRRPPSLQSWQSMRMLRRAENIEQETSAWPEIKRLLDSCSSWSMDRPNYQQGVQECWHALQEIKHL
ncbi:MAG: hypothetical protein Q9225_006923, partial [Loekoesia sp. 1 TL-2023]